MLNAFAMVIPKRASQDPEETMFYFKIVSPKIEVLKEYAVYDFSGILGSVGGSLGLFVGFSFLDCLFSVLDRAYYVN